MGSHEELYAPLTFFKKEFHPTPGPFRIYIRENVVFSLTLMIRCVTVLIGRGTRFTSNIESVCAREDDTYFSAIRREYHGAAVMPVTAHWSAPNINVFSNTITVTSGTIFTFSFYARVTRPQDVILKLYFPSPSAVFVPGTVQATNAPGYKWGYKGSENPISINLRPTVFVRE